MTDKILTETYARLTAIEEAVSSDEEQINVLTLRMRRATEDDDEAAYHRAVDQLNALTDKMQVEEPIEEGAGRDLIRAASARMDQAVINGDEKAYRAASDEYTELLLNKRKEYTTRDSENAALADYDRLKETRDDSSLHDAAIDLLDDMLANEQYSEKADILRYAIKRLQEVGLGR